MIAHVEPFFDPATQTLTYVVHAGRDAVVIDAVLDYDPCASEVSTASLERVAAYLRAHELVVHFALETHCHADHLSGGAWLRRHFGAKTAIGARITEVQATFRDIYDFGAGFPVDGRQFDRLVHDGEVIDAGALRIAVIATPGHTPACVTYHVEQANAIFTGDALFIHDYGTGRCDFPKGSPPDLYDSIQRLYALPDATRVFPAHDYQPGGRALVTETTIGRSKTDNIQLRATTGRDDYVRFRVDRDQTLSAPKLIWQSVQVNLDGGRLPRGRFLKIPIALRTPVDDDGTAL